MRMVKSLIVLSFLISANCSTKILVPVQHDKYDQLAGDEKLVVHLKSGERCVIMDYTWQNGLLSGMWYANIPFRKTMVTIRKDSISFILAERKNLNDVVPAKSVYDISWDFYDEIFVIQKNGELLEIRNPEVADGSLLGTIENKRLHQKYNAIPLGNIGSVAVRGILDPWGNPISYREIRQNYYTYDRMGVAMICVLLSGLLAFPPSLAVGYVLDESIAASALVWLGCMAGSSALGYRRGERQDQNRALEKIVLERSRKMQTGNVLQSGQDKR